MVTLTAKTRLQDLPSNLNVLAPVMDDEKHYWSLRRRWRAVQGGFKLPCAAPAALESSKDAVYHLRKYSRRQCA